MKKIPRYQSRTNIRQVPKLLIKVAYGGFFEEK